MKLYLSGGIAGVSDFKTKFRQAQLELEDAGYEVVNPCDIGTLGPEYISVWTKNMRADVAAMMECDGVALMPDWQTSRGAVNEATNALHFEMPVMLAEDWLNLAVKAGIFA